MKSLENRLRPSFLLLKFWQILDHYAPNRLVRLRPKRLYGLVLEHNEAFPLTQKALLSYIVHPLFFSRDNPRFRCHIRNWHASEIIRILNELGYIVDVIDSLNDAFKPQEEYDLFIGERANFEGMAQKSPSSTKKIFLSGGTYWRYHNEQLLARCAAICERKGIHLPPDRLVEENEDGALRAADGIIGTGNRFTKETFADFSPVIMLNNTALSDNSYKGNNKDFERGRSHFLYYAGRGPIHKGLDLLLEAFTQVEQHLWICSDMRGDTEFMEVYADELHNRANIHLIGWIQPRSAKFYELMNLCNYIILPSCSEGMAAAVIEGMNQGLIPIVSQECGLDVDDYGYIINPCTIAEIIKLVTWVSGIPTIQHQEMSTRARQAAVTNFSEAAFHRNMREAIVHITGPVIR